MDSSFIAFVGSGKAELMQRPVPELAPSEILIEAEASLISAGTERSFYRQAPYYPFFPGYSLVGRVVRAGSDVRGFAVGDRVAASAPHGSLVACEAQMAFAVPAGVSPERAAFMTVGATALYAVRLAQLSLGDPILIVGQGLIGLIASQIARIAGAAPVIGIDIDEQRLALSARLGADAALHAGDQETLDRLLAELPGGGVAATIDLSGAPDVLNLGVRATRRRGRVIAASLNPGGGTVDLYGPAFLKGIALVGAYFNARPWQLDALEVTPPFDWPPRPAGGDRFEGNDIGTSAGDSALVLELIKLGRLTVDPLITDEVAPADAPALFARLPESGFLGGIIRWDGRDG